MGRTKKAIARCRVKMPADPRGDAQAIFKLLIEQLGQTVVLELYGIPESWRQLPNKGGFRTANGRIVPTRKIIQSGNYDLTRPPTQRGGWIPKTGLPSNRAPLTYLEQLWAIHQDVFRD